MNSRLEPRTARWALSAAALLAAMTTLEAHGAPATVASAGSGKAVKASSPRLVPSRHPGVMVLETNPAKPAKAKKSGGAGWIYVRPGTPRSDINRARWSAKSTARTAPGASKAGGVLLFLDDSQMPAERAHRTPNGKMTVECTVGGTRHTHPAGKAHPTAKANR